MCVCNNRARIDMTRVRTESYSAQRESESERKARRGGRTRSWTSPRRDDDAVGSAVERLVDAPERGLEKELGRDLAGVGRAACERGVVSAPVCSLYSIDSPRRESRPRVCERERERRADAPVDHVPHAELRLEVVVELLEERARVRVGADLDELEPELVRPAGGRGGARAGAGVREGERREGRRRRRGGGVSARAARREGEEGGRTARAPRRAAVPSRR